MYELISNLILYGNLPEDEILVQLAKLLSDDEKSNHELRQEIYGQIKRLLELATQYGFNDNLWHNYLTYLLMTNENPFSMTCEKQGAREGTVNHFALNDFKVFYDLFHYDFRSIEKELNIQVFLRGLNKRVKDLTYKELLKYNLFDTTQKVPLFSDVIKLVNGRVPILIETKYHNRYGVLEKILINELSNYRGLYAIQSFYPMSLLWLKRNTKDIPIGLLSSNFKNDSNRLKSIIGKTLILDLFFKTDFISYDVKGLPNNYLSLKKDKKKIVIWTIKNKKDYDLARQYTDSLICENFDWL